MSLPVAAEAHTGRLLELDLRAPAGCASRDSIVRATADLVRNPPEFPLWARAVIHERGGRFYLELSTHDGQRRFDGATCRAVSEALVVILALTLDPHAETNARAFPLLDTESGARPSSDDAVKAPPAASVRAKQSAELDGAPRSVSSSLSASLDARGAPNDRGSRGDAVSLGGAALLLGELGILPRPGLGALALLHVGQQAWRAEIGVSMLLPRSETLPSGAGGTLRWFSAQANGCRLIRSPFAGCLGLELGRMLGRGFAVDRERTASVAWGAAVASISLRAPLSTDLSLEGRFALAVPWERPRFGVDGQFLHRAGALSGRASMGIAFR